MGAPRKLLRPRDLPPADIIAMAEIMTRLNAAIALVPGDPHAETMAGVFRDAGIYRRSAHSFTAREGGDALSERGRRIFSLIPDKRKRRVRVTPIKNRKRRR